MDTAMDVKIVDMAHMSVEQLLKLEDDAIKRFEETGDGKELKQVQTQLACIFSGKVDGMTIESAFGTCMKRARTQHEAYQEDREKRAKMAYAGAINLPSLTSKTKSVRDDSYQERSSLLKNTLKKLKEKALEEADADDDDLDDVEDLEAWEGKDEKSIATNARLMVSTAATEAKSLDELLKAHQVEGIDFLMKRAAMQCGGLLAFAMGLGKTLTTLAFMNTFNTTLGDEHKVRAVIICPASVVGGWCREHEIHSHLLNFKCIRPILRTVDAPAIVNAWKDKKTGGGMLVMSYDMLGTLVTHKKDRTVVRAAKDIYSSTDVFVIDEMHMVKNASAKRAHVITGFETKIRIGLTGTPLANSPNDFYNIVQLLDESIFSGTTPTEFNRRFTKPILEAQYADANWTTRQRGREQMTVLRTWIAPVVLHRSEALLRKELPVKTETMLLYNIKDPVARNVIDESMKTMTGPGCYLALQPIVDTQARTTKVDIAINMLDRMEKGDAALVFSTHPDTLHAIENKLDGRGCVLDGRTRGCDRSELIDGFARGKFDVLLLSYGAGATGINCQRANMVLLLDPRENPTDELQAACRAWRLGQKQEVSVYRLAMKNTVDVRILRRGVVKTSMAHSLLHSETKAHMKKGHAQGDDIEVGTSDQDHSIHFIDECHDEKALKQIYKLDGEPAEVNQHLKRIQCHLKRIEKLPGVEGWAPYDSFFAEAEANAIDDAAALNGHNERINKERRYAILASGDKVQLKPDQLVVLKADVEKLSKKQRPQSQITLANGDFEVLVPPIPIVQCDGEQTKIHITEVSPTLDDIKFKVSFCTVDESVIEDKWTDTKKLIKEHKFRKKKVGNSSHAIKCRVCVVFRDTPGPWSQPSAPFVLRDPI